MKNTKNSSKNLKVYFYTIGHGLAFTFIHFRSSQLNFRHRVVLKFYISAYFLGARMWDRFQFMFHATLAMRARECRYMLTGLYDAAFSREAS